MRSFLFLICIWIPAVTSAQVEFDIQGLDRTEEYQKIIKDLSLQKISWKEYKNYKVLFVNGFLSDQLMQLEPWPIAGQFARSFDDQKKWFTQEGIEYQVLPTKSQQIPEVNVPLLTRAILESKKPVIFISHSRGGLDVLQTLLSGGEELHSKVRGWIALQAPFQGTPMADEVLRSRRLKKIVSKALVKIGGSIDSVIAMSTVGRKKFMAERNLEIKSILSRIPMISFSSWKPNEIRKIDTTYELQRNYLEDLGYQTDGLVPWQSEIIPGLSFVFQFGVDHPSTVGKGLFFDFDRVQMTQALLKILERELRP